MPSAPPAPAWFSTTTGCFSSRASASATGRATVSATPPGGKGTIIVIGRSGQAGLGDGGARRRRAAGRGSTGPKERCRVMVGGLCVARAWTGALAAAAGGSAGPTAASSAVAKCARILDVRNVADARAAPRASPPASSAAATRAWAIGVMVSAVPQISDHRRPAARPGREPERIEARRGLAAGGGEGLGPVADVGAVGEAAHRQLVGGDPLGRDRLLAVDEAARAARR